MEVFSVTAGLACSENASSVYADVLLGEPSHRGASGSVFHVGFLVDAMAMEQVFPLFSSSFPS
jgi:hypothetical protein